MPKWLLQCPKLLSSANPRALVVVIYGLIRLGYFFLHPLRSEGPSHKNLGESSSCFPKLQPLQFQWNSWHGGFIFFDFQCGSNDWSKLTSISFKWVETTNSFWSWRPSSQWLGYTSLPLGSSELFPTLGCLVAFLFNRTWILRELYVVFFNVCCQELGSIHWTLNHFFLRRLNTPIHCMYMYMSGFFFGCDLERICIL